MLAMVGCMQKREVGGYFAQKRDRNNLWPQVRLWQFVNVALNPETSFSERWYLRPLPLNLDSVTTGLIEKEPP